MRLVPASARAPQAAGVQSEYLPGIAAQLQRAIRCQAQQYAGCFNCKPVSGWGGLVRKTDFIVIEGRVICSALNEHHPAQC